MPHSHGRPSLPTPREFDDAASPLQATFAGELWYWRGPSPYHFITVPDEACAGLRAISADVSYGWGMIPVRVRIDGTVWDTSLFPKDGRYVLPVKDVVRKGHDLAEGDTVMVELIVRV